MKQLIWIILILVVLSSLTGCSRAKRIAHDVNWIFFDGEPSKDN